MNLLQKTKNWAVKNLLTPYEPAKNIQARTSAGTLQWTHSFDGEKNMGEIGPVRGYMMDYDKLRARSWQCFTESDIAKGVLKKYILWVIGDGLKLKANPNKVVLKSEKITLSPEAFNEVTETRWNVWSSNRISDYSAMKNLNLLESVAFKNVIIGGDVLVVLRFEDNELKVQLIDGAHLNSPMFGSDYFGYPLANGNEIKNGIEMNAKGEHVAYYIQNDQYQFDRIPAKGSTGLRMAYLVYGDEYRIDNTRGVPLIMTVLETLKKLERYKEATVGSAEERQKIVYYVVHKEFSTGESPFTKAASRAFDDSGQSDELPIDIQGQNLANNVQATTNKMSFNLPVGSDLKSLVSQNELYFKDFYDKNIDIICASIGIPPNVAMSLYNDSFSASRAAIKDWEHTLKVARADFSFQFLQPIYDLWLHIEVLKNKVQAPGYLKAFSEGNNMVLSAYRSARFTGANVPHIDPVKEVTAERLKLGTAGAHIPLTNAENATENLNGGDSDSNMAQFAEELKELESLGIKPEAPKVQGENPHDQ
jgi:capsid protein